MKWVIRFVFRPSLFSAALALSLLGFFPLCASARSRQITDIPEATNYLVRLKNHIQWSTFPVSVYFVRNAEYSHSRERTTRAGFDVWVQATRGFVNYQVQENPDQAQIIVRFDPLTNDGRTTTRFEGLRIVAARISVGVERGWERDLECIAAHEFGHALGIDGHSGDSRDVMYPVHRMGRAWSITRRDLTTVAMVYAVDPETAVTWRPQSR